MAEHKKSIVIRMQKMLDEVDMLRTASNVDFLDINNSYSYSSFSKEYEMKSKSKYKVTTYQEGQEVTENKDCTETFVFKDYLPTKWTKKLDGETTWKFTYGKATFTNPNDQNS